MNATTARIIIPQSGLDDIVLNDFIISVVYSVIIVTANITINILTGVFGGANLVSFSILHGKTTFVI